ncbi:hypothetical protein [Acidiferrobacter sp.]|uniref:hypothetical protein n=1 Tax=Acidiferrobacter sp. TaxID=1872107 RepID=UPI0026099079|nr:hypothetical protein [Acidiferrobacter sp.]
MKALSTIKMPRNTIRSLQNITPRPQNIMTPDNTKRRPTTRIWRMPTASTPRTMVRKPQNITVRITSKRAM